MSETATVQSEVTPYRIALATRDDLLRQIIDLDQEYERQILELRSALREQVRLVALAEAGVSLDRYQIARQFVSIRWGGRQYEPSTRDRTGPRRNSSDVQACFDAAIEEFRAGPKYLLGGYYGVKEYDRWTSQRNDSPYGYGPRHGYVWFKIGIPQAMRAELQGGRVLTDEEKIAVVGWLTSVRKNPDLLDAGAQS
ncbi:MAG: hypothetical protein ACJLS2_02335 [Microcella pacifica]